MAAGHNNVAAVGTSDSNAEYGTNFKSTYRLGDSHEQVAVLKANLRDYRGKTPSNLWIGIPSLIGNTSTYFDSATDDNLAVFQMNEGLTVDGIYGNSARSAMHAFLGVSPLGFVRVYKSTYGYSNYNDTSSGLSADAKYKLDHSWVTSATRNTLAEIGQQYRDIFGTKIELNDGCLIDGENTPEHSTHEDGKDMDIRNAGMTAAQEKKLLEILIANSNVDKVLFYKNHGLSSSKIIVRSDHADHFHVDFFN
ncbi:peptidoglycan-binding protein [Bacillus salitolerans]|uniref:Peptidoglycan-binding protein n=1 Tax=Bacillus salitolerans TaxID=1437434 RepID=A0ABW4LUQ5_9BACI